MPSLLRPRQSLAAAIVLTLLLAGCGSAFEVKKPGTVTATATAAPTTPAATATATTQATVTVSPSSPSISTDRSVVASVTGGPGSSTFTATLNQGSVNTEATGSTDATGAGSVTLSLSGLTAGKSASVTVLFSNNTTAAATFTPTT